ncbi:hypothetical protein [Halobacillus sp. Marseille-P3879]|uniref:hypothetical protein n=1 Tax=Halobacillus sp. Marseille-P3879 TaxID=2045014 RepID=UPI000C7A43BD|nr:hypothetical protein [Halobacillus sp. Marseille-P3879]
MSHKARWILIAIISAGFTIAVYWSMNDDDNATEKLTVFQNPSVEEVELPSEIEEVESREDIEQFYEAQMPGYKKAKEMNIVQSPEQSFDIPEHEGTLTVNEIWHSEYQIFMFYSVDLAVFEDKENSPPHPFFNVSEVNIRQENGELPTQTHPVHTSERDYNLFKIHDGKLYSLIQIPRLSQEEMDPQSGSHGPGSAIDESALTSFRIEMEDGFHTTEESQVHYTYEPGQDTLYSGRFNEKFEQDGLTIRLKEFERGLLSNKISLEMEHEDYDAASLEGTVTIGGEVFTIDHPRPNRKDPGTFEIGLPPDGDEDDSVKIDIDHVTMLRDEEYSFAIDVSDYDEMVESDKNEQVRLNPEEKIAEHLNTDIILEEKNYNPSANSQFRLSYIQQSEDEQLFLSAQPPISYGEFNSNESFSVFIDDEEMSPNPGMGFENDTAFLDISSYTLEGAEELRIDFNKAAIAQKVDLTEKIQLD